MTEQSSGHRRLAAELAVGLARRLWMALEYEATDNGFCFHSFQNPFVDGCHVLWELGVALISLDNGATSKKNVVAPEQPPFEGSGVFKFLPAPETRAGVLAHRELPVGLFERLIAAYIGNACLYGAVGTQLCSGSGLFKPTAEFEREIDALVECGYAERSGAMFRWTDKMASVMRAEHCWDEPESRIKALSPEVLENVKTLLQQNRYIAAIVLVREETGADLAESKFFVDNFERKLH